MSKRVYKFTAAKYAICNLQNKRLKLATTDDLNDPFDLCAIDTTDPACRSGVDALVEHFKKASAILCFSRNWDNPAPRRREDGNFDWNFDLALRILRTKHESWSYEQEVRMFVGLNDPPDANGRNWFEFGPQLMLKEVIIGAQCHPHESKMVEDALKPYGDDVKCWWAGMRPDAFLLVKQDHPPYWQAVE